MIRAPFGVSDVTDFQHGGRFFMLDLNTIHQLDCIQAMRELEAGSVDLTFADPPFNIGYDYDVYKDRKAPQEYLDWSSEWILKTAVAGRINQKGANARPSRRQCAPASRGGLQRPNRWPRAGPPR